MDKKQIVYTALIAWIVFLISNGLSEENNKVKAPDTAAIENKIASLEADLSQVRTQTYSNNNEINGLTSNLAFFTPTSKGYTRIATPAGSLMIILRDIEKYANGYRLFFDIGNPTLATFADVKMIVRMNKEWDMKTAYSEYEKKAKTNEVDVDSEILPGRWNHVAVVVSPAEEQDTDNIQVQLLTNKISLYK